MAQLNLEDLKGNFLLFDDWEERYRYLIDLGKNLPVMEEVLKNDDTIVKGCTSRVWLICQTDDAKCYHFTGDSDAHIVRGLMAILFIAYQGKTAAEIGQIDISEVFEEIGLNQHLSPNRRNGFFAMMERIKALSA